MCIKGIKHHYEATLNNTQGKEVVELILDTPVVMHQRVVVGGASYMVFNISGSCGGNVTIECDKM